MKVDKHNTYAHIVSWGLTHGAPPKTHLKQQCGNRRCVNPEHWSGPPVHIVNEWSKIPPDALRLAHIWHHRDAASPEAIAAGWGCSVRIVRTLLATEYTPDAP